MTELKIFELRWTTQGEKEWVCAKTNIQALMHYLNTCGIDINELDEADEVIEIPKEKWGEYTIQHECRKQTFAEYMQTQTQPDIIATTVC